VAGFCGLQSFVWQWRLQVLLSLVVFLAHFQAPVDDELCKEEDNKSALLCNFVFFASFCVKLSFPCTANYFA
jgi:hypothetical protein